MTKKPIIFSIDDDPQVLKSIKRDLRNKYKEDYKIMSTTSANEALEVLPDMKKNGEVIALFLSDQRMPEMFGVDFLHQANKIFPESKMVLLTAYSDIDVAVRAINDISLDYYLLKPWDPPEEKLYPVIDDLLDEWKQEFTVPYQGMKVVGYNYSPLSHRIKDFLAGNLRPFLWVEADTNLGESYVKDFNVDLSKLPAVILEDGEVLQQPSVQELAPYIGLSPELKEEVYDVVIIGAGPAGLAAGVYGGSEGLKTLVIEKRAPGGQAGTSSRIENYLGFPKGLSGADLSRRAITQVQRFGVDLLSPRSVDKVETENQYKRIVLENGDEVHTKSIIIASGVSYRTLPAKGADKLSGAGIYYGAATTEASGCADRHIFVVGGGNSAGQGAVYLAKFARKVTILIRKPDLTSSMSSYLIDQIDAIDNIEVLGRRQIIETHGEEALEGIAIQNLDTDEVEVQKTNAVFVFIGAKPSSDWLGDIVRRDERGFVLTGTDLTKTDDYKESWSQDRTPHLLESSVPGIFAAGDVRSGAMNRVASAVGEGSMAIKFVHSYLAE